MENYQKKYLEFKIKYFELKKKLKNNQHGGYNVDGKTYTVPKFSKDDVVESGLTKQKGTIISLVQIESPYHPTVYENYYNVKYDSGLVETIKENLLSKVSNAPMFTPISLSTPKVAPSISLHAPSPYGPSITYVPSGPFGTTGPLGPFDSNIYQTYNYPPVYKPTVYYEKSVRKSSRKSSKKSSRKSSRRSRK
jgi:hypothetical protein